MSVVYLSLGFLVMSGWFGAELHADHLRDAAEADLARLTAALPPARVDLSDWPVPLSPLDLPGIGQTQALAVRLSSRTGRHRADRWDDSPTGQFWAIVDSLSEPCTHCATPEDGEPAHAGCPGCACPCSLVGAGVPG